jgi:hypothetical protein
MTIESHVNAVGTSIRVLVNRLTERGFRFERPAEALPGPENNAAAVIARVEREVGVLRVGSIDLWVVS